jgi:hypothetical protein
MRVVPAFNEVEDRESGFMLILETVLHEQLAFESRVKTLAHRTGNRAVVALIPMAFAVFGGPYVHWQQVVGAIPAALLLFRLSGGRSSIVAAAVVAIAIPWLYVVAWGPLIPGATAIAALLVWDLLKPSVLFQAATTAAVLMGLTLVTLGLPHTTSMAPFIASVKANDWADISWGSYVRARIPIGTGTFFWLHFPTWAGLLVVVSTAIRLAVRPLATAASPLP